MACQKELFAIGCNTVNVFKLCKVHAIAACGASGERQRQNRSKAD